MSALRTDGYALRDKIAACTSRIDQDQTPIRHIQAREQGYTCLNDSSWKQTEKINNLVASRFALGTEAYGVLASTKPNTDTDTELQRFESEYTEMDKAEKKLRRSRRKEWKANKSLFES